MRLMHPRLKTEFGRENLLKVLPVSICNLSFNLHQSGQIILFSQALNFRVQGRDWSFGFVSFVQPIKNIISSLSFCFNQILRDVESSLEVIVGLKLSYLEGPVHRFSWQRRTQQ